MVSRTEMVQLFLKADSSLEPLWQELAAQWPDRPAEAQRRLIANLAHHLIVKLSIGETERFPQIFDAVETCLARGEAEVRADMRSELLADLQNNGLHASTSARHFERWLRPVSMWSWVRLSQAAKPGQESYQFAAAG